MGAKQSTHAAVPLRIISRSGVSTGRTVYIGRAGCQIHPLQSMRLPLSVDGPGQSAQGSGVRPGFIGFECSSPLTALLLQNIRLAVSLEL